MTSATSSAEPEIDGLESGRLTRFQLTSLSISSMIPAVGMASFPMLLVINAGAGSWLAALISALTIVCVGRAVIAFARRYVASGSLYSYVGEVFGAWARSLTAASLLLGYLAMVASILLVIGAYTGSFLLSIGVDSGLDPAMQIALYAGASIVTALITYRGLDASVRIAVALTVVCLPLLLVVTGASAAHTGLHLQEQLTLDGSSVSGIVAGIASGSAFLVGFEGSAALAAETRDPKRSVPVAVMSVPVILGALYLIATILQAPGIILVSDAMAAGASPPAALAHAAGLPDGVGRATDLVVAVSTFAALIGFVNYGSRFAATLSAEGLLPRRLARVHPRFHSPAYALLLTIACGLGGIVTLVLASSGPMQTIYSAISTLVVYFWVIPYTLICVGAAVLLFQEGKLTAGTVVCLLIGTGSVVWVYISGILFPPPSPADAMSYVAVSATAVLAVSFAWVARRRRRAATAGREGGEADARASTGRP
ncbi:APC family permease [Nonomuraea sp. NPDC046570]|uniref:APC family permease n=1 Tax=Nonomuraea sp. NPDC046570 TaxID=3155255 RepID=UPI00340BD374